MMSYCKICNSLIQRFAPAGAVGGWNRGGGWKQMNNDLREIAIRTDLGDAWENPFSHEDVAQAISTIRYINSKDLTENTYDLLTALEALHRQQPKPVKLKHKEGEDAALITCPVCWHSAIINFKLHKQFYSEWYCKHCGQRLFWGDEP